LQPTVYIEDGKENERLEDIEQLLREGNIIKIKPQGYSMYPMIVPGRDEVIIEPVVNFSLLKRGDVVLYRRDESILVLHRIWKIKSDGIYLVGDNQEKIEGPLRPEQIKGKLISFIRRGREISVTNIIYRCAFSVWLLIRPFRVYVKKTAAFIRRKLR